MRTQYKLLLCWVVITFWSVYAKPALIRGQHITVGRMETLVTVAYTHHAIYLGHDLVCHFTGESGKGAKQNAQIRIESLAVFLNGALEYDIQVASYSCSAIYSLLFTYCYSDARFDLETVAQRAEAVAANPQGWQYDLIGLNCEHFATWASSGILVSRQSGVAHREVVDWACQIGKARYGPNECLQSLDTAYRLEDDMRKTGGMASHTIIVPQLNKFDVINQKLSDLASQYPHVGRCEPVFLSFKSVLDQIAAGGDASKTAGLGATVACLAVHGVSGALKGGPLVAGLQAGVMCAGLGAGVSVSVRAGWFIATTVDHKFFKGDVVLKKILVCSQPPCTC